MGSLEEKNLVGSFEPCKAALSKKRRNEIPRSGKGITKKRVSGEPNKIIVNEMNNKIMVIGQVIMRRLKKL